MRFTPESFSMLLEGTQLWFEFLMRLNRRRMNDPEDIGSEVIPLMLRDRARQLRN
jgi:hypothetical protein